MSFGPELCWPPVNLFEDFKYSIGLLFKPKDKILNMEDFEKIRQLENQAYPEGQHAYKRIKNLKGLKRIFACNNLRQIDYYLDEDCYCIVILHHNLVYVADIVSLKNPQKTLKLIQEVSQKYKEKPFYMYAREKTAYKLMKALERKGMLRIVEDVVEEEEEEEAGEVDSGKENEVKDEIYHMLKIDVC